MQQEWDQGTLGTQRSTIIGSRTRLGPSMDPAMALYILAIFLYSMQQNWDQGTLVIQRLAPLGLGPALVLQWTLPWPYNTPNVALCLLGTGLGSIPSLVPEE